MSNSRYGPADVQEHLSYPHLRYITRSKYEQDWRSIPHSHPFIEFSFIEDGEGTFLVDGRNYSVSAGDLVLIPPNRMHTEMSAPGSSMEYFFLGVDNMTVNPILCTQTGQKGEFCPVLSLKNKSGKVRSFFLDIYREMQDRQTGYSLLIQGLLLEFSVFLSRQTNLIPHFSSVGKMDKDCAEIKRYLDEHYADKITLEQLSLRSFVSKYHLIHEFNKYVGTSPINYVIEKRIDEAKNLLLTTEMSVTDISVAVGFSSPSHLSQRFRLSEGCSPLQFRQRNEKPPLQPAPLSQDSPVS